MRPVEAMPVALSYVVRKARFADTEAPEPAWKALHRAGDKLVTPFTGWMAHALEQFADGLSLRMVRAAADGQHSVLTERLVELADAMDKPLDLLLTALRQGGEIGAQQVPHEVVRKQFEFTFDIDRPEALAFAQQHAARLVQTMQDGVTLSIREIVVRGLREGRTVRDVARDIKAMGPVLGLDRGRATAVVNLRRGLEEAGRSREFIDRTTSKYAERLLRQRATTIARTEVLTALNAGQREAWRQARQQGSIRSVAKRVWIVTPDDRLCKRCEPQEDITAPIEGLFKLNPPAWGETDGPPLHPDCRCAEGLQS